MMACPVADRSMVSVMVAGQLGLAESKARGPGLEVEGAGRDAAESPLAGVRETRGGFDADSLEVAPSCFATFRPATGRSGWSVMSRRDRAHRC